MAGRKKRIDTDSESYTADTALIEDEWDDVEDVVASDNIVHTEDKISAEEDPAIALSTAAGFKLPRGAKIKAYEAFFDIKDKDGTVVFAKGEEVPVVCRHCALWNRPMKTFRGKPLCTEGKKVPVMIGPKEHVWAMRDDIWSCQSYYIPPYMSGILDSVDEIDGDYGAALALKWIFPLIRAIIKLRSRITNWHAKHDDTENAEAAFSRALDTAFLYSTQDEVQLTKPFFDFFVDEINKRHRKAIAREASKYHPGDTVSWTDKESGNDILADIRTINPVKKNVSVILKGSSVRKLKPTYYEQFKKQNPDKEPTITLTIAKEVWDQYDPKVIMKADRFEE